MSETAPSSAEQATSAAPTSDVGDASPTAPNEAATADERASALRSVEASGAEEGASTANAVDTSEESGAVEAAEGEAEASGEKKKRKRRKKRKKDADGHEPRKATDRAPFQTGEEVFGRVTAILDAAIMVDLSGKALGIFDRAEMEADDLVPSEGDRFLARVHQAGARGGLVVLTRKPLREEAAKPMVEAALKSGELVPGLVTGVIKGGVDVDIGGLRAFAPASGMDLHPQNANFAAFLGQRLEFKVTQYANNGRDVVVTRRPMLEAEAHERRKKALAVLKEGEVLPGVVRTVVEWGAFVALPTAENLEGLVHITEASHDPRARMSDLCKPGDKFDVKIVKVDEKGKIWLSRRELVPDPWKEAKEKYPTGARFAAKVTRVESFGAFCQLDGIEGLIHVSDLSAKRLEHANEVLSVGDDIEVVVHQFDLKNHKVALHPALVGDRAAEEPQKITRSASLKVEVVKAESAGVQVRVKGVTGRAARGFIPAGQTGTERGTDLRKHFHPGQELTVSVVDIDPRRGEPKLSIRRFHENEERNAHREYRKKLAEQGGFGTLGDLLRKSLER